LAKISIGGFMSIKKYNNLDILDKEKIIDYYYKNKNCTFSVIAKELSVSIRGISRVLREANINTKRKNRYTLNENYFNKIDSEEKAYILGFIYADGFVGDNKFNNIAISSIDEDIIRKIKNAIEFTGDIRKGNKGNFENSKISSVLNFSSKVMASDLRKIGLYPNKSMTISSVPDIKSNLERHFIRGYFDGDGSIILSHNTTYHIVSGIKKKYTYPTYGFDILGTESMLNEVKNIMNLKYHKLLNTKTNEIKRLVCRAKSEARYIFEYLYKDSTIFMDRKYEK
jgi:hypothetical protein